MKKAFATWKWSLGVVARSPLVVVVLGAAWVGANRVAFTRSSRR